MSFFQSSSAVDQGSQGEVNSAGHGGITTGQMTSFVSQIQQAISDSQILSAEQAEPRPGVEQQRPGAAPAVSAAAPTTTQYLCSCITITPLAPAHHTPASASPMTDAFTSVEASAAQVCSSGSVNAPGSDDCVHQHAAQSSPVQEQTASDNRGTSHSAYAANKGGY